MEIRFEEVRVSRGGAVALHVPALTLRSGRVTALLGPNGSGKTTLLRALAALDQPATGRILLDTQPVGRNRATREAIAFAFQAPVFLTGSVRTNLDLGLRLRRIGPAERKTRIQAAAGALGVSDLLDRDARRLSGGEAQRVNLARALALRAPLTLLDEPLAGLDAPSRETLLRDLPRILRELPTVVLVTHDREEAARLAEDVVLLVEGKLQAAGPLAEVFTRPPNVESARFLGWSLVPYGDSAMAIRPGALTMGDGDCRWMFDVEQVLQMGERWEILGAISGVPAAISGRGPAPGGCSLHVSAATGDVLEFPAGSNH